MATYNAVYKRYNGSDWDVFYFATLASQVSDQNSTTRKWTSPEQVAAINKWLSVGTNDVYNTSKYNTAGNLAYVESSSGKLPVGIIPSLSSLYLPLSGGTMTGDINLGSKNITNVGQIETNKLVKTGASAADFVFSGYSNIDAGGMKIINAGAPVNGTDLTTKAYVDMLSAQGTHLVGAAVAASTAHIPTLSGLLTIDGITLVAEDRVLVRAQTTAAENGVYIVKSGAWVKIPNESDKGTLISVISGATNGRKQYYNDGTSWVEYWVDDDYGVIANGGLELDGTGLLFGIANSGVTTARINDSAVTLAKLGTDINLTSAKFINFASDVGSSMSNPTTAKSLNDHLKNIYKMIHVIKGSTNVYDEQKDTSDNAITIASLHTQVNTAVTNNDRIKSYIGSSNPTVGGTYREGDLYFQYTT